ncbi:unnamed protein product [Danaus chrysippus]|uniref:(African queen) hypothetical protein n=1 Tax=Danaus chrysippus TaxID=151541 RepID=A0A8J2QQ84_9NEOP|nr:unnamed protein product [Danaus chrysippus]
MARPMDHTTCFCYLNNSSPTSAVLRPRLPELLNVSHVFRTEASARRNNVHSAPASTDTEQAPADVDLLFYLSYDLDRICRHTAALYGILVATSANFKVARCHSRRPNCDKCLSSHVSPGKLS